MKDSSVSDKIVTATDKVIHIVTAIVIAILLFLYLIIAFAGMQWMQPTQKKTSFTQSQINQICETFKFELAQGESIYTEFFPGFGQARTTLRVFIEDIKSEEEFLSRFHGTVKSYDEYGNEYRLDLFPRENPHWEYREILSFHEIGGSLTAVFYVNFYIEELAHIYKFVYNPYSLALLARYIHPYFIIPLIIEILLVIYLILKFIKRRKHHGSKCNQGGKGIGQGDSSG